MRSRYSSLRNSLFLSNSRKKNTKELETDVMRRINFMLRGIKFRWHVELTLDVTENGS